MMTKSAGAGPLDESRSLRVAWFGQESNGVDAPLAWAQAFVAQYAGAKIVAHPIRPRHHPGHQLPDAQRYAR
jgi:hypothetical protein